MDSAQERYQVDANMSDRKGEPRFQPARVNFHDRADQSDVVVRNAQRLLEQATQPAQNMQNMNQTIVRDDQPPAYNSNDFRDRIDSYGSMDNRDRIDSISNDSLINLSPEELAQREREIFGEHYWQKQQQQQQQQREQREQPQQQEMQIEENFPELEPAAMPEAMAEFASPISQQPKSDFDIQESRVPSFVPPQQQKGSHVRRPIASYIRDLVMWRNTKDSAVIFTLGGFLLFSLSYFSFISIISYTALTVLMLATGVVFGKQLMYTLRQQQGAHPFQRLLQRDVVIDPSYAHQQLDAILAPMNTMLIRMRNLFLADSLGQSLKLALFVYALTYVGAWFNLLSLAMLVWVMAFTMPRFYVMYRSQIDSGMHMMRDMMESARVKVMGMISRGKVQQAPVAPARGGSVKVERKVVVDKHVKSQ